ncbi:MAG: glycosyl hydrolase family 28 protein [Prevotellaceae bacterium]|nr:glycosyl hydrolase family 28 protein [Prevotellaceae bacterium]
MKSKRLITCICGALLAVPSLAQDLFPDGTPVSDWFHDYTVTDLTTLGKRYDITAFGAVSDSTVLQTAVIQSAIDAAAGEGGGVVVISQGTYLSGALFFKPGTHLYLAEGAVLKGSDDIGDFPIVDTRIEGQSLKYFAALVNADHVDGFTLSGKGTINGNGVRYWKSFWLRREVNPECTNMDELRPRLVYISHSNDVQVSGVRLINSPFWTTHLYKCSRVKLLGLHISSPAAPVPAPSTDAIDIDACSDILVKDCYMSVNDDAIALKGGKGPWADEDGKNGANERIIIEDCTYGFCHSALTCGSESIHDRNIVLRRIGMHRASNLLWLKMRPDTPQLYEYILVEDIQGDADNFLLIKPWTQFFDLKGRTDIPLSYASHITMRNISFQCRDFFNVEPSDQYVLSDFTFQNLSIQAADATCDRQAIDRFTWENVEVVQAE